MNSHAFDFVADLRAFVLAEWVAEAAPRNANPTLRKTNPVSQGTGFVPSYASDTAIQPEITRKLPRRPSLRGCRLAIAAMP